MGGKKSVGQSVLAYRLSAPLIWDRKTPLRISEAVLKAVSSKHRPLCFVCLLSLAIPFAPTVTRIALDLLYQRLFLYVIEKIWTTTISNYGRSKNGTDARKRHVVGEIV